MRFGVLPLTDRSAEEHIDQWRLADDLGFDLIGIPDSPTIAREMFLSVSDCLQATTRASVITAVSNPVTRDPSVSAAPRQQLSLAVIPARPLRHRHWRLCGMGSRPASSSPRIVSSSMSRQSPLCYEAHRLTLTGVV